MTSIQGWRNTIDTAVSWLTITTISTISRQLVTSWLDIQVSCGGANYTTILRIWVYLFVGRLVS